MADSKQWFLIHSATVPADLELLREDLNSSKPIRGRIVEDFGQTLVPQGRDIALLRINVPPETVFAGVLWGDGLHFDEYADNIWGILGELELLASDVMMVRGPTGEVVARFEFTSDLTGFPRVVPPEVFGLKRARWWTGVYPWLGSE